MQSLVSPLKGLDDCNPRTSRLFHARELLTTATTVSSYSSSLARRMLFVVSRMGHEMPPADFCFDKTKADYWRGRSEEARVLAESMGHNEPKATMLRIAEEYENIARWCEKQNEPMTDSTKIFSVKEQTNSK